MICISLIICLCLCVPVYADSKPIPPIIGVQTHYLHYPEITKNNVGQMMKRINMRVVREELTWQRVENVKGKFSLDHEMEAYLDRLKTLNIKTIMILDYGNINYTSNDKIGPNSPELRKAFGDYVAFLVSNLKGKVFAWEIWNEPDHPGLWKPAPSSRDYSLLVKSVAPIIRRIDPKALIIAGALSNPVGDGREYLDSLQKESVLAHVDVISFHWYSYPKPPGLGEKMRSFVKEVKGLGKRAWITEMGYPTSTDKYGVSEAQQAEYLRRQIELAGSMGVEVCIIYDLIDDGPDAANRNDRHGLLRQDGSPKPAAAVVPSFAH